MIVSEEVLSKIIDNIKLHPQECPGNCKFIGRTVMTPGFIQAVGEEIAPLVAAAALEKIHRERPDADYLQVLEYNGTRFWIFDESEYTGVISVILPDEY